MNCRSTPSPRSAGRPGAASQTVPGDWPIAVGGLSGRPADLLSQYVKFTTTAAPNGPAYAVVWLKSSKRLIVGLALPEAYEAEGLGAPLPKTTYRGLTKYFAVEAGSTVPGGLATWAGMAYRNTLSVAASQAGRRFLSAEQTDIHTRHRPSGMAVTPS